MFKVSATERGLAAEEEMKGLKVVHSRELVINYSTDNQNIYNTVGKKKSLISTAAAYIGQPGYNAQYVNISL